MWQRHRYASGAGYLGAGLGAALLAAGVTYLLDPDSGRRRRAWLRDQLTSAGREAGDFFAKAGRDARNRAKGAYSESRARLRRGTSDEAVLSERVRARLGRLCSHASVIQVTCEGGLVRLSGDILQEELDQVLRGVRRIHGVTEVVNELNVHTEPDNISALQGEQRMAAWRWAPAPRVLVGGAGLALLTAGLASRRAVRAPFGYLLAAGGLAMLGRSLMNRSVAELVSRRVADAGVLVEKTLDVHAPIDEAYSAWRNLESFPKFMSHVREVRKLDEHRYHWVVDGPAGVLVEWDAEVTAEVPQELIAWRTLPGASVQSSGVVQFEPNSYGGTRIHVRMSYRPPADAIGHTLAKVFGRDPQRQIHADLLRFKAFIETGRTGGAAEAAVQVH